ncbi:hypothetical protein GWI33_011423 [Rhynchophorus ferrugineus]|uniref:Metaxin-1 n=1 Tax=Rhynchophorus ferrugineus TaxID=354439 RepID=A0A834IQ55_RHYFE|nr:hypothetical protein GWI33_011423 [Rhynchophorus ferrugineus]
MSATEKFQLYVYDGDFGLPSVNVECLQTLLLTTIAKVPVQVKTLNTIKNCTLYSAPCFVHKNISFKSFTDTVLYLKTLNYDLDRQLNAKQKILEFVAWIDQRNCNEFTRIWYCKALPMPFNIIHTNKFKEKATNLIESLYPNDSDIEVIKDYLATVATECLSSLSTRLGSLNYFFGNSPSTLDITIYSYLAPLMKLPFPSNSISNLAAMWPNLVAFVKRIDTKYFPNLPKESKYIKKEETNKPNDDEVSYVAISILTFSAMSLVLGFAISKGFISSSMF